MSKMKSLTLGTLLAASTIWAVDVSVAHARELKTGGIALQQGAVEQRAPLRAVREPAGVGTGGNALAWGKDKAKSPKLEELVARRVR